MAQNGAPIVTPATLQTLVASTFGGYQTSTALNNVVLKTASSVLSTCENAASNVGHVKPFEMFVVPPERVAASIARLTAAATAEATADTISRRGSLAAGASRHSTDLSLAHNNTNNFFSKSLFEVLLKRWPRGLQSDTTADFAEQLLKFVPTVADILKAYGVRERKGGRLTAAAADGSGEDHQTAEGDSDEEKASGADGSPMSDDDDEIAFPRTSLLTEVVARARQGCYEYDQRSKQTGVAAAAAPSFAYQVTDTDLSWLLDATNTTAEPNINILLALVFGTAAGLDVATIESASDAIDYLTAKVLWAKEWMAVMGPAFKLNPHLDSLRKRLAANWASDSAMQALLLTEEERTPPPPPPPPAVEEAPKKGAARRR